MVFADWLDEHGWPERAAFVRAQCTRDALPPDDPRRGRLDTLAAEAERDWLATLPADLQPHLSGWDFQRGFAFRCRLPGDVFLRHAIQIAGFNLGNRLSLRDCRGLGPALADCTALAHWPEIDLDNNQLGTDDVRALAGSPHLSGLVALSLVGNRFAYPAVEALAESPHLARLAALDLSHNAVDSPGLQALALSPHLSRLTTLHLAHANVGPVGVEALARRSRQPALRSLDLSDNRLERRGVRALAAATRLGNLARLKLAHMVLDASDRAALLRRFGPDVCLF
jgi:hypothetical protein